MTKPATCSEVDPSEWAAMKQEAMQAKNKTEAVQQQVGDLQSQVNNLQTQMNRIE